MNLLANSTTLLLTRDATYNYIDSYYDSCLSQIDSCDTGFTLSLNLSIIYQIVQNSLDSGYYLGRTVLLSSGGDLAYTTSGFYVHQVNVRGENYIEVGVKSFGKLIRTLINYESGSSSRLALVWNKVSLTVYVDGNLIKTTTNSASTPSLSLGFNQVKSTKTLISIKGQTAIYFVNFTNDISSSADTLIKGNLNDYFIGCYATQPYLNLTLSTMQISSSYQQQCKKTCYNSSYEVNC